MKAGPFEVPFNPPQHSGFISAFGIVSIYSAIYLRDLGSEFLSNTFFLILLTLGALSCVFAFLLGNRTTPEQYETSQAALIFLGVTWSASVIFTGTVNSSSYFISVLLAALVTSVNPRLMILLCLFHLGITIAMSAYEYISGEYVYVYVDRFGLILDEKMFGGLADVFRAKGMFQGPLSQVAFALWMAFIIKGSLVAASGLFLVSFFASGRLGLVISSIVITSRLTNYASRFLRILPFLLLAAAILLLLFSTIDEKRADFALSAFDLSNDQNISRMDYWQQSFLRYQDYDFFKKVFGNFGFIAQTQGGTENDFLRILLDCGFTGLMLYMWPITVLFTNALKKRDREDLLIAILIPLLMNIFPFIQSLSSSFLFWMYFFSKAKRN